jgi:hypothetical protein
VHSDRNHPMRRTTRLSIHLIFPDALWPCGWLTSKNKHQKIFLFGGGGLMSGRRGRLRTSLLSVSLLSRKCMILDISEP